MTFHDPASIESGCVNTRGRNHETHKREMYLNNFLFWVTVLGLQTLCTAVPDDVSSFNLTEINLSLNKSINSIKKNNETILLSSLINDTSINTVKFLDVPKHTSATLGKSVLLECRTSEPVIDCQWSWRPLPPVHLPLPDINPMETINDTSTTTTTVIDTVSQPTQQTTQSLPVRLFPAFGNNNNDCSVRFTDTQHEQMGYWTCAARKSIDQSFVSTEPAMLSIIEKPEVSVTFIKTENATEAPGGSSSEIICRTEKTVKECQWSWRMFNQSEIWNLEVKKFPSFGIDSTDCSLKFKNVLSEQEGLWTCGARINQNDIFTKTHPIRFLVSEVEFVQLSSGIQTSVGESALLKCLVDKPVIQCEWSWKPINSSREPTVIKKFVPNNDNEHDCSVRFKNVLYEEEGLWTCGVRLTTSGHLHEAPPAKLTLLPSGKLSFVEISENKSALVNTPETLKCLVNGKVDICTWLWRPLTVDIEATIVREFTTTTNGKNCSLDFSHIQIENQGYWSCRVTITSSNTVLTSPSIKLIVSDDQEKIEFSELSQDIQIASGGSVSLRCVTTLSVEQCRWSLTPVNSNTTVVVKQFPAVGPEARDCSVRLSHALAEQEGLWTCGAKVHGKENYTNASPAKLSLLEPAIVMWTDVHRRVTLACTLDPQHDHETPADLKCQWIHDGIDRSIKNESASITREEFFMNYTNGMCTLKFIPRQSDFGNWICRFIIDDDDGLIEIRNISVVLRDNSNEDKLLAWAVGAATIIVLFFMILVVVLVVFRGKLFDRTELHMLETIPFEQHHQRDKHRNSQNSRSRRVSKIETKSNDNDDNNQSQTHTNPVFHDTDQHPPLPMSTFNLS